METELKTLKDLNSELILLRNKKDKWILEKELRQEAIKWVKILREQAKENPNDELIEVNLFTNNEKRKANCEFQKVAKQMSINQLVKI